MNGSTPETILFFGRMHPLLVHIPIALLLLLALIEFADRGHHRAGIAVAKKLTLWVTALGAGFAALFGWLLARGGGYDAGILQTHQYAGFATAGAAVVLLALHAVGKRALYRGALIASCAAMAYASHLGGSLTHGADYLTEYMPSGLAKMFGVAKAGPPKPIDPETALAFDDAVKPVLKQRCFECHSEAKQQGDLRLDSVDAILKGGKEGASVVAGKSMESRLIQRMLLPEEDRKRMPPDGHAGATPAELTILKWWIDAGAASTQTVASLKPPARVLAALVTRYGGGASRVEPLPREKAEPLAAQLAGELKALIGPQAKDSPWIDVNASLCGKEFGDAQVAKLAPIAANIRRLDLSGTALSDTGMAQIAAFANLQRLSIPRTQVTDAGLVHVQKLADLEVVNLYGTAVTDAGLDTFKRLPKLKRLYAWQTKVTPAAAQGLADAMTDVDEVARMKHEIEELQARIRASYVEINTGAQVAPVSTNAMTNSATAATAATATAKPFNDCCPVKLKGVDNTITALHDGKLIAFCCKDCKAAFEKEPAKYAAKIVAAKAK